MSYTDSLLADGERILLRRRQHWLAWLINSRAGLAMWLLAAALMVLLVWLNQPAGDTLSNVIAGAALVLFAFGLLVLLYRAWQWRAQDYLVTNRRLLKVEGIVNKHAADSSLAKINDAVLAQGLIGRLLNYGDLEILTAAELASVDDYHMLAGPREFKIAMLNAKHALEMESADRRPVVPPLRAVTEPKLPEQVAAEPAPAQPRAVGPAPVAGQAPAAADASAEITRTLARLADLRDRGAISAQEYEAKKTELLGRL
jgi:membrane protein YdbS with pleckstrin-like domain